MLTLYILIFLLIFLVIFLFFPIRIIIKYEKRLIFKLKIFVFEFNFSKFANSKKLNKFIMNKKIVKKMGQLQVFTENNQKINFETLKIIYNSLNTLSFFIKNIFKKIKINEFVLNLKIAGDDAANTALNYGKFSAIIYPIFGLLFVNTEPKKCSINISPDFLAKKNYLQLEICLFSQVFLLLTSVIAFFLSVTAQYGGAKQFKI